MRRTYDDLARRDVWTPRDVSVYLGCDYKSGLKFVKELRHIRIGRRYLVSRSVVLNEIGLGLNDRPLGANRSEASRSVSTNYQRG